MVGSFKGTLIGYDEYTKDGKTTYSYMVLVLGKEDPETKLYGSCDVVTVREDKDVLPKAAKKYGQAVTFEGELVNSKVGAFMRYINISAAN